MVIGSAIYMGRWLKTAREFVSEHVAELSAVPVWLFSSDRSDRSDRRTI